MSGTSSSDTAYTQAQSELASVTSQRNTLAGNMLSALEGAEFNGQALDEQQAKSLMEQAQALLSRVARDAAS